MRCKQCGGRFISSDIVYKIENGEFIHEDCYIDYAQGILGFQNYLYCDIPDDWEDEYYKNR